MKIIIILFIILFSAMGYSEELPLFFDSGIDNYIFYSRASTEKLLKNKEATKEFGFSTYEFKLGDTQIIQFIVHPGSVIFEVSEIKIIVGRNKSLVNIYPGKAFTQKGISLGISKEELISKLGKPNANRNDQLEYKAEYHKGILDRFNMPIYYGKYTFEKNKLISFSFGFEYP